MKRVMTVVLIAALTGVFSGIDHASGAAQDQDAQKREEHRREITRQLRGMRILTPIQVERTSGDKFDAVFQSLTANEVTVLVASGGQGVPQTIPIDEIEKIKRLGGHTARNVLIGVGVAFAVLLGACASAV